MDNARDGLSSWDSGSGRERLNGGDDGGVDNGEESSKKLGSESQEVMLGGEEGNGGTFGLGWALAFSNLWTNGVDWLARLGK
jgi:hypothetical protein